MKSPKGTNLPRPLGRLRALVTLAAALASFAVAAQENPAPKSAPPAPPKKTAAPKKPARKARQKLTGAELYAINCNRCHPERYAAERTEDQWKTIVLHMRTRANIPAEQARAILKFLQEDSGK